MGIGQPSAARASWSPRSTREGAYLRGGSIALLIVLSGAAVLRLAVIGRQPLWADELFSLAMATGHSLEHPAEAASPARGDFMESARPEPPPFYSRYLEHEDPPAEMSRVIRAVFLSDISPPLYYLLLSAWTRLLGTSDWALRLFSGLLPRLPRPARHPRPAHRGLPWAALLNSGARLVSTHRFESAVVHVFEAKKGEPFTLR